MLVLSRKVGEKIKIGPNIVITVNRVAGHRATLGIEAPGEIRIVRAELPDMPLDAVRPSKPTVPPYRPAGG